MKLALRLLLLGLATNLLGAKVCAAERLELRRENIFGAVAAYPVGWVTQVGARLPDLVKTRGRLNLSERLVFSPQITKGGFGMRVNLNF